MELMWAIVEMSSGGGEGEREGAEMEEEDKFGDLGGLARDSLHF